MLCLALAAPAAAQELAARTVDLEALARALAGADGETGRRAAAADEDDDGVFETYVLYTTSADFSLATTLIGLVNCNPQPVGGLFEVFDEGWQLRHAKTLDLAPHSVHTFNLRDHLANGIASTGVVRISTSERVLVDASVVDTSAARASGGAALGERDLRPAIGGRAFLGAGAGLGTLFRLLVTAPQGPAVGVDPATLLVLIFRGDGTPAGALALWLGTNATSLDFAEMAAEVGFGGVDAKVIFLGMNADLAAALGLDPPTEAVEVGGFVVWNAGSQLNVGDRLRGVAGPIF